jgi:hypothetical protein
MRAAIAIGLLISTATGCAARRELVAAPDGVWRTGTETVTAAPRDAVYTLLRESDGQVVASRFVPAGGPLGFRRDSLGTRQAVAGSESWTLDEQGHHWTIRSEDDRRLTRIEREKRLAGVFTKTNAVTEYVGTILYPPLFALAPTRSITTIPARFSEAN